MLSYPISCTILQDSMRPVQPCIGIGSCIAQPRVLDGCGWEAEGGHTEKSEEERASAVPPVEEDSWVPNPRHLLGSSGIP